MPVNDVWVAGHDFFFQINKTNKQKNGTTNESINEEGEKAEVMEKKKR